MRVRLKSRALLMVVLLAASVLWGGWSRPALAEGGPCLPENRLPVTVLVRANAGESFAALESDDATPFIDGDTGRTVVPLRSLVTALDPGTDSVRWYADIQTATFWHEGHTLSIKFPRGADRTYSALLDNEFYSLTSYLCDGRVWVTARTVSEAFGIDIQYFEDGVVLIDGVGRDPWAPKGQTARSLSKCVPFPDSAADFLWSPIAASRQSAASAACLLASQ